MNKYIQMMVAAVVLVVGMTGCQFPQQYPPQVIYQPQPVQQPMYGYQNSSSVEVVKSEDGRKEITRYVSQGTGTNPAVAYQEPAPVQYATVAQPAVYVQQPTTYVQVGGGGRVWVNPNYNRENRGRPYAWEEHRNRNRNNGSPVYVTPAPDVSGLLP